MRKYKGIVLLDRDGVLNADSADYIKTPDELEVFTSVADALSKLRSHKILIFIVSNQSAIARGFTNEATLGKITEKLLSAIGEVDGVFYCPHGPDDICDCRKPKPGLLLQATNDAKSFGVTEPVWMIGDSARDIDAGHRINAQTILVLTGKSNADDAITMSPKPDFVCEDLAGAVDLIISNVSKTDV